MPTAPPPSLVRPDLLSSQVSLSEPVCKTQKCPRIESNEPLSGSYPCRQLRVLDVSLTDSLRSGAPPALLPPQRYPNGTMRLELFTNMKGNLYRFRFCFLSFHILFCAFLYIFALSSSVLRGSPFLVMHFGPREGVE